MVLISDLPLSLLYSSGPLVNVEADGTLGAIAVIVLASQLRDERPHRIIVIHVHAGEGKVRHRRVDLHVHPCQHAGQADILSVEILGAAVDGDVAHVAPHGDGLIVRGSGIGDPFAARGHLHGKRGKDGGLRLTAHIHPRHDTAGVGQHYHVVAALPHFDRERFFKRIAAVGCDIRAGTARVVNPGAALLEDQNVDRLHMVFVAGRQCARCRRIIAGQPNREFYTGFTVAHGAGVAHILFSGTGSQREQKRRPRHQWLYKLPSYTFHISFHLFGGLKLFPNIVAAPIGNHHAHT